ncbi:MAG: CRTAC1 family protein [Candidatus Aminicenantales bacterium]
MDNQRKGVACLLLPFWIYSGVLLLACRMSPHRRGFVERRLSVRDYYLFDIGVVDANGDGILDVYTSNHTAQSSLLLGDAKGNFRDVLHDWGLDHQKEFPGLENLERAPDLEDGGRIAVAWVRRHLLLKAEPADSPEALSGVLTFPSEAQIIENRNWKLKVHQSMDSDGLIRTEIEFQKNLPQEEALLIIDPELVAVPYTFRFDPGIPLETISVGAGMRNPTSHTFVLRLKDRHGMAWADANNDTRMDMFISHGGMSGKCRFFPEHNVHELFLKEGGTMRDAASEKNIIKNACRSRQVAWVDADRDGLLDIFVSGIWSPNQLFKQLPAGCFKDVAKTLGIQNTENGLWTWVDAEEDGDLDLLIAGKKDIILYGNEKNGFQRSVVCPNPGGRDNIPAENQNYGRPVPADFDNDGDIDIFVASASQSILLVNRGHHLEPHRPESFGLPLKALTACWVDGNNDGLLDLHTIPGGLYRQVKGLRFIATRVLALGTHTSLADARCTWFDADNDGDRDVIISLLYEDKKESREWQTWFFQNEMADGHWLEVDLQGPLGNRNAVGAHVSVELENGQRLTQVCGASEGAHYSQGHYRVYFGLGKAQKIRALSVLWPDGTCSSLMEVSPNQILVLTYPSDL